MVYKKLKIDLIIWKIKQNNNFCEHRDDSFKVFVCNSMLFYFAKKLIHTKNILLDKSDKTYFKWNAYIGDIHSIEVILIKKLAH